MKTVVVRNIARADAGIYTCNDATPVWVDFEEKPDRLCGINDTTRIACRIAWRAHRAVFEPDGGYLAARRV